MITIPVQINPKYTILVTRDTFHSMVVCIKRQIGRPIGLGAIKRFPLSLG